MFNLFNLFKKKKEEKPQQHYEPIRVQRPKRNNSDTQKENKRTENPTFPVIKVKTEKDKKILKYTDYDISSYLNKFNFENGDTYFAVQLLDWLKNKTFPANYPQYFYYTYGIEDPISLHKSFIDYGFLERPNPEDSLVYLTIPKLKDILRDKGLKVGGKKQDLIDRIIENIPYKEIENLAHSINVKYQLSPSGEQLLDNNDAFVYLDHSSSHQIKPHMVKKAYESIQNKSSFNDLFYRIFEISKEEGNGRPGFEGIYLDAFLDLQQYETYLLFELTQLLENIYGRYLYNIEVKKENENLPEVYRYSVYEDFMSANYSKLLTKYKDYYTDKLFEEIYNTRGLFNELTKNQLKSFVNLILSETNINQTKLSKILE